MLDLRGEDRSRFCFPLYYDAGPRTYSRTSGCMERDLGARPRFII
ncbi:hypothetical protein Taro_039883 [Colocasia esculenta]|uniref:Uncharacterized protein n=1 Tax=Colocasia esculenta TaxID=4460 RepID=A0A843WHP1_COLES|nr:hypothetical protein [Colocasia esculenta]